MSTSVSILYNPGSLRGLLVEHVDPRYDDIKGEIVDVIVDEDSRYTILEVLWAEKIDGKFLTTELPVDVRIIGG